MSRHQPLACAALLVSVLLIYPLAQAPAAWRGWGYIALHGWLSLLMLLAWFWHGRLSAAERSAANRRLLWTGVIALLLLLAAPPLTTHDPQRYLWDGRVLLEGVDPYRVAPQDPRLTALHQDWPTPPEHRAYPTLYPPAALGSFALAAAAGAALGPVVWKALITAAALALLWVAAPRGAESGRHWPLLALSPLLWLEVGVGAHLDVLVALCVALLLAALQRGRLRAVGAWLGLGALFKLLPVVALWPLLWQRGRGVFLRPLAMALAVLGLGYGLALALELRPWGSLGSFFTHWRFGTPLGLLGAWWPLPAALIGAALLSLSAVLARQGHRLAAIQSALLIPLLCSPVLFPWYLLVLLPGLARQFSAGILLWSLCLPLSYEVLPAFDQTGLWAPAKWPLLLVALAWVLGFGWDVRRLSGRAKPLEKCSPE